MSIFQPDFYFQNYREITIDFLKEHQVSFLLLDIDNTFAPYEQPDPNEENLLWFQALKDAKIEAVFLSNNDESRVKRFDEQIGIPFFAKAKKPLVKYAKKAIAKYKTQEGKICVIGDQIFTDVLTGKRLGAMTVLVPPIKDKTDFGTKLKRVLEKPIMKSYHRRHQK